MAGKNTISITFKLDGDGKGFKQLANDADGFKKAVSSVVAESQKLNSKAINFAAIATGIDQAQQSVMQLQNVVKDLTRAYAAQVEVETQLETNMRNSMNAREADIDAIKHLCSEQQKLGVIGDEVQLAGAQQLAMFTKQRASLEALIPAMNDLIAQQYGYNASQSSATSVAAMMGKVLGGNVGLLKRNGMAYTEAQEKAIKFGSESEKVAALVEIITKRVGGMNAKLAQTSAGKQKQLENTLGDIKETLGGMVQGIQPYITLVAQSTTAIGGIAKLTLFIKRTASAVAGWNLQQKLLNITLLASGMSASKVQKAVHLFSVANKSAAASAVALKLAIRGLLAATAVGAAITALTIIIEKLVSASDDAANKVDELTDATARAKRHSENAASARAQEAETIKTATAALTTNIAKLKDFNGTKAQEKKLVDEMNTTYGDTMGYFASVSAWYKALTANSKTYCQQITREAKVRKLANQIAELELENNNILKDSNGKARHYSNKRKTVDTWVAAPGGAGSYKITKEIAGSSDIEKATAAYNENNKAISNLNKQMEREVSELNKLSYSVKGSSTPVAASTATAKVPKSSPRSSKSSSKSVAVEDITLAIDNNADTLKGYEDNIRAIEKLLQTASLEEAASLNKQKKQWQEKADAIRDAGVEVKSETKAAEKNDLVWDEKAETLSAIESNLTILENKLSSANAAEAVGINKQITLWTKKAEAIRNAGTEATNTFDKFRDGYSAIKSASDGVQALTDALEGNSSAWAKITGVINALLQIYDGLVSVVSLLAPIFKRNAQAQTVEAAAATEATAAQGVQAATASTTAEAMVPIITANKEAAASALELATAQFYAAHAYIPFAGFAIGTGFATAAKAITMAMGATPFANGGVLYGPTLGLLGEYAGARNNPEVVAPLDKLRSLIEPQQSVLGKVKFEIDGRKLVGVISKVEKLSARS